MTGQPGNKGLEIDIFRFFRTILKKWWLVVLLAASFAVAGIAVAKATYTPMYSSNVVFISNNRQQSSDSFTNADVNASIDLAPTFKYILTSDELLSKVSAESGLGYSVQNLRRLITVTVPINTVIIEIKVTTNSPETSLKIARAMADNYEPFVSHIDSTKLSVFGNPTLPKAPDTNSDTLIYGLFGGVMGIAIAIILIVIFDSMRATVRSVKDIQNQLNIPVIGKVGHFKKPEKNGKTSLLITDRAMSFDFVEAYKTIRTKLELASARKGYHVFAVTSAAENEGKTTVSVNVAIALAQNGKSVLLMDADLRKPAIHKALGLQTAEGRGLVDVISGDVNAQDAIRYVDKYGLFVLLNSTSTSGASEILSSEKMPELLSALRKEFDYIIIDTAPASLVTDAALVSKISDTTLLVVRDDATPIPLIEETVDLISESGKKILGCVYNNVEYGLGASGGSYYRYGGKYGYRYGHHYGHHYGHKSSDK